MKKVVAGMVCVVALVGGSASAQTAPPPNIQQALSLLDQAKQQSVGNASTTGLINQAEGLIRQPPPHPPGGQQNYGQRGQGQDQDQAGMGSLGQSPSVPQQ